MASLKWTKEFKAEYMKAYREKNRERIRTREKAHWVEYREHYKALCRARYHSKPKECHQRVAEWKKANPDAARRYVANNYQKTKEKRKRDARDYYHLNKLSVRRTTRAYSQKNKEKLKAYRHEWYLKNMHKVKAGAERRRAVKLGATVGNMRLIVEWQKRWKSLSEVRCYWCMNNFTPSECASDHIIALDNRGPHRIENLCISCRECNTWKHAKTLHEWLKVCPVPFLML